LRSLSYLVVGALALASCAPSLPTRPSFVSTGRENPAGWPSPRPALAGDPPQILALRFSALDVALGNDWSGEAVTSSNTASVDFVTNLFDSRLTKVGPGRFSFNFHLLDAPPFFVRTYGLRVIARSANGRVSETLVPFRIRGRAVDR